MSTSDEVQPAFQILNEERGSEPQCIEFSIGQPDAEGWRRCKAQIRLNSMPDITFGEFSLCDEDLVNWGRVLREVAGLRKGEVDFEPMEPAFRMIVSASLRGYDLSFVFDTAFIAGRISTGSGIGCQLSTSPESLDKFADFLATCLAS